MLRILLNGCLSLACFGAVALTTIGAQAETLRIGGSGLALAAMRQVGEKMTAVDPNLRVEALPGLSTNGGVRAMIAGEIDILLARRALTTNEFGDKIGGEAACLTTALVLVTSHGAMSGLTKAELSGYYAEPKPQWPDGTTLKIILRLRDSQDAAVIATKVPGFAAAYKAAHLRKGVPVAATDQDNAELALRIAGSLTFMTLLQIRAEQLALRPLALDGVVPSIETIADKTYPLDYRVCLILSATPTPAATRLLAYVKSPEGQSLLRSFGAVLAD